MRRALLLCTCAGLSSHLLLALDPSRSPDQYIITRWGRDSFPGGTINAIAQTPDGYLWIGTENSLVRFDGTRFRVIDQTTTASFPPSPVLGLITDREGLMWVRMQSPYLVRYRRGNFEQMFPERIPPEYTFAREEGAAALARGTGGEALIATPAGPLRHAGGQFVPAGSSGPVHRAAISIAETEDRSVWVGMRQAGLLRVSESGSAQLAWPDQKVNVLLPAGGKKLWVGTDTGLARWDGNAITRQGVPSALLRTPILALASDRDANLWVSTPTGVSRMDSKGATIARSGGELPGVVHAIFEDREGNLWFGGTEGLMQLRDAPFLSFPRVASEGASLYAGDTGRTWVAPSSGGLQWMRGAERQTITAQGIDRDVIYSITGGPGEVWVGRRLGGVTQLWEEAGLPRARSYTERDGLAPGVVNAVHRSRDGSVWAGTFNGAVSRIDKGRITTFTTASGLSADAVTTIQETPDGVIWVGTSRGLAAFREGRWRRYGGEDGLPPGRVNSLALDSDGVLWVASSWGLFFWSGTRLEGARNAPELLQREIYGLAADGAGNLWATTNGHVVSVSRAALAGGAKQAPELREFGIADGLPSPRGIRRDHSVVNDRAGRIWFSLQGGLCVVNPSLPSALAPAIVTFEAAAVDGRPVDTEPMVRFKSSSNRVVFHFVGVSLTFPGHVRYRYLLEGYDRDWSQPTETREVAYTNLPPAGYTFRVMASNSQGLWNGTPASLLLEVEPRLSETWWFRLIALFLMAVALYAAFHYRLARVHAAMNLRFEERLAERTRIARELHDTLLQTFQALMLHLQVVNDLLPPGKAKHQLEQSLDRADQAIEEGRSAVYDLRSATTTNDLEQAVQVLGDELAKQGSAAFRLLVEGKARELHPIIRDEAYRIIGEALRNASRHAEAKQIEVELAYEDRMFRVRIRDDGRGIPPELLEAGRPGHYGLSGMRERAHQIGARLEIWSAPKAGTEIELTIGGSIAFQASQRSPFLRLFRKLVP